MYKRKKKLGVLLLAAALTISTCAQGGGSVADAAKKKPKLSSKKITLRVGKTKKLSVKNAGKKVKAKWKSKSKKIATVSKKGKVKAKKAGKTWITCKFKYKGKKYTLKCKVTVKKKLVPTKKPVKSKKPVNTQKINTGNPNKTDGAVKTESPSGSNPPATTSEPDKSTKPVDTSKPADTSKPGASTEPADTNKPGTSTSPTDTDKPATIPPETTPQPTKVPGTPIPVPEEGKALKLDFEDGKNLYMTGRQGEETLTVEAGGYNDNYCLKVSNRKKNWAGPKVNVTHNVSDFATYTVEAYVKHTAGGDKTINCMWEATDFAGEKSYITVQQVSVPTGNWKKIEATVVAPGDVQELFMYFEMENYPNDFYVDNISVSEKHLDLTSVLSATSLKEAYANRFPVGCAVYSYNLKNPEILAFIKHHYNAVTFADELKPESLLNEEKTKAAADGMPVINTDVIDKCLSLAKANDLQVRFHTLVWHSQTPDWYFCEGYTAEYDGSGTAKKNITNLVDKATMLKRIESYVTQIITYTETKYPGTVYAYDVVNEVINDNGCKLRTGENSLYGAIFTDEDNTYVTEAFKYAKAAKTATNSSAKLFYNDYVGLASPGQMKAVVNYLKDAKTAGYIDGLGMQSHQSNLSVSDGDNIKNALNLFRDNGYEVQITELDFKSKDNTEAGNQTLATAYSKFMQIILTRMDDAKPVNVTNVTFWNLTDLDTWLNDGKNTYYPSLFDENYMPKPAFEALVNLVKGDTPKPTTAPTVAPTVKPTATPKPTTAPTTKPTTAPTSSPGTPTATPTDTPDIPEDSAKVLDLADGNIVISEAGYSVGDGGEQAYTGAYRITGSAANTIKITGGTHEIILDSVTAAKPVASPISLTGDAKVTLQLKGESKLTAPDKQAGIEVTGGCELTITGDGKLFATGGTSSAGIGVSADDNNAGTLGKIVIQSGTIIAYGGRNGAGIGDGRNGHGGGEICIYGGNIFGQSSGNGAGIGGGGSESASPEKLAIKIYGGVVTGGGSSYAIGDGKGQTHCEVSVYGGSCYSSNSGKILLGSTVATESEYEGKSVNVSSLSGIQSVTIDGVDQKISSFVIVDNAGKVDKTKALNLFMTKADSHIVVVTDTEGVEHTYEF